MYKKQADIYVFVLIWGFFSFYLLDITKKKKELLLEESENFEVIL